MERLRNNKTLTIIALVIAVVGLSVGFAAFSSVLTIQSHASVTPDASNFKIVFSSDANTLKTDSIAASPENLGDNATINNEGDPTISGLNAKFTSPGESVTYKFYVRNEGEYLAYLNNITFKGKTCTAGKDTNVEMVNNACDSITTTVSVGSITTNETKNDITGETLAIAESKLVTVTISYASTGGRADGPFTVEFGDISMHYATVNGMTNFNPGGNGGSGSNSNVLEGDGQEYYTLAPSTLTFRSQESLNSFKEVKINGETVDMSNYTLTEGSTIVTLPIDYLKTLFEGTYNIEIVSENNIVSGEFHVVEPEKNEHGFYYNQPYTAYVPTFGGNTVFFIKEGGIMELIVTDTNYTETATYTATGNDMIVNAAAGTFTGTFSDDGMSVFVNELYTSFMLGSDVVAADNDYFYTYKEELGGYEVTAIDKTKAEYGDIKTGINGHPTVKLADEMFNGNDNLTVAPKIPNSVTTIGKGAFQGTGLTSVVIPDSVTTIGKSAFQGTGLTSVVIPDSVTTIETEAFSNNQLTSVTIGNGVTTIYNSAFSNNQLTSVTIPDSVTTIFHNAFDVNALTSVVIKGKSSTADFVHYGGSVFGWATGYSDANITWQPQITN